VHVLRAPDGPGGPPLSADELNPIDEPAILETLEIGEITMLGRIPRGSNATFLVEVGEIRAVYKPLRGERPLWDFAPGLHRREVAAYRLSRALGLGLVPPTVVRDGPLGEGSLQWFVEDLQPEHYFSMLEERPEVHDRLREVCAFDVVANNTDRKAGHCILDSGGRLWAIDHGVCFSADFKLRTVIWEFGGEAIADDLLARVEPLVDSVPLDLSCLLDDDEVAALSERARWLIDARCFPVDPTGSRYPWPLV